MLARVTYTAMLIVVSAASAPCMAASVDLDRPAGHRFELKGQEFINAFREIQRIYDQFACLEINPESYSKRKMVPISPGGTPTMAWIINDIVLERETTFLQALERFCEAAENAYKVEIIAGQPCLLPLDAQGKRMATAMDAKVSLTIKEVSPDTAFLALRDAHNERYKDKQIEYITSASQMLYKMPELYHASNAITLELSDVTVRESICRIFEMSPLWLEYKWSPRSNVLVIGTNYKLPLEMIKER